MLLTMSALPRLLNCTASAVLERAENYSEWAGMGQDSHADLAADVPDELAHLCPDHSRAEVKIAYDVAARTARFLGDGDGREYGALGPFEIAGSIDRLWVEGDTVFVLDWKSGYADVDPASRNWQLWGYGLAAATALGKSKVVLRIVYTKQGNRCDEHTLDALDLAEFAGRLEWLHRRVPELQAAKQRGEVLDTREGSWCKHCASKHVCPSKVALIGQMSGLVVIGESVTPETAAVAYEQIVRVEQIVTAARQRLNTYVDDHGPIDLGNGRMFGRYVRKGNERLSGSVAMQAIREVVGESAKEFESVAIEHTTSKAAIERAAKQLGCKRGTVPAVVRRVRELGGTTHAADPMPIGEFARDRSEPAEKPQIDTAEINRLLESAG
ncbi:MAG: DUF2800 domain-containing protein [Acidobacteria bacterium]|nr:MAG: DUF2800 domain-containing protein [Acidobacteriota bacterium]